MAKRRLWAGIDPGKHGFISVYDGINLVTAWPIPYVGSEPDLPELHRIFRALVKAGVVFVAIEHQQVMGVEGRGSAFTLGAGYMALRTFLIALKIPHEVVRPDVWKSRLGIPKPATLKRVPPLKKKATVAERKKHKAAIETRKRKTVENKKLRKELAIKKAQELDPYADFTKGPRSKVMHDGKCESFLLAVYACRVTAGEAS